jgi:hypothetical protein
MLALLSLLLLAAPERARFLFELRGVPVGTVELSWDASSGEYRYRSSHLFVRGQDRSALVRSAAYRLGPEGRTAGGEPPASFWLWRQPPAGSCVTGFEEIGGKRGLLCLKRLGADGAAAGTLFGERFRASYRNGRLSALEVGDARFMVAASGTAAAPVDLFGSGLVIEGGRGPLLLDPPRAAPSGPALAPWDEREARALAESVHASFSEKRPSAADLREPTADDDVGSCLAHARRFVKLAREAGREAIVVYGLLADGRAYPHAWVRVALAGGRALELDPTSLDEVTPSTHLALAADERAAGGLWLDLLAGRYRVRRGR